ncbi:hypothetical protein [Salinigranum sp. GCM10025319]|uniref:hypothetical protein n=1 Tax=Salinigranum sp. GCM10025319 TaxID=3252687 RepID=UPI0036238FD8
MEQALAVVESVTATLAGAEDERDDPVAEEGQAHRGTAFSTLPPGALSDDDVYREYREASKRIDEQIDKERKISRIPYEERLRRARNNSSKLEAEEVWLRGFGSGLFTEREKEAVYADQNALIEQRRRKKEAVRKQIRTNFEIQQTRRHVARGEQLSDPRQILQPFVFGAFGTGVAAAYAGAQTGAMVGETVNACRNGTAEECAAATARLGADIAVQRTVHRAIRREPVPGLQNEPRTPPGTRTSPTSSPSAITETLTSPSTTTVRNVPLTGTPGQTATRTPTRRVVTVPAPVARGDPAVGSQRASTSPVSTRSGPISPLEERIRVLGANPSVPGRTVTVGMQARITVSEGPVTEGLKTAGFAELDELRAAALGGTGRAAVLPEVTQPPGTRAREGSTQPSSGLVVEPSPRSPELEVLAWNTGGPVRGSNVSHAERQFVEWFRTQDRKWLSRVKSIDVKVFGRDVCPDCTADLRSLQTWLRTFYPGIEINWVRADSGRPFKPERAQPPAGPR